MTEYQKKILKAQEDFLIRESQRYFSQRERLLHYSWFRRLLLGKVYNDLLTDCEELHKYIGDDITKIAQLMMEKTFIKV
jgi:hypothetical protein